VKRDEPTPDIHPVIDRIRTARERRPAREAPLIAVSGIDASGKGFVTALLREALDAEGLSTAAFNVDSWFDLGWDEDGRTPEAFYRRALRIDEMLERLVLPLVHSRSVHLEARLAVESTGRYYDHTFEYDDVDVVLVEGIFLFKPRYCAAYDSTVWVDCSFETAMERAIERAQEGLDPDETRRAFENLYFPAQRVHFERDAPRSLADVIVSNDPRLAR